MYPIDLVKPLGFLLYACKLRINLCQTFQSCVSAGKQNKPGEALCICWNRSLSAARSGLGVLKAGICSTVLTAFRIRCYWISSDVGSVYKSHFSVTFHFPLKSTIDPFLTRFNIIFYKQLLFCHACLIPLRQES